jgi:hypothetical protein
MNCKFAIHADFGYSDYTTEGTTLFCAKKLHPAGDFDQFYGEDLRMHFAIDCSGFEEGEGPCVSVERSNVDELTEEQRKIYAMREVE